MVDKVPFHQADALDLGQALQNDGLKDLILNVADKYSLRNFKFFGIDFFLINF